MQIDTEYYAPIERGQQNEFNPSYFSYKDENCILWVFRYLEDFELGKWPRDFSWDNTSVGGSSNHISHDGNFCTAKDVIGEIRSRVKQCDYDGELFTAFYEKKTSILMLAHLTRRDSRDLSFRINRVLDYIQKPRRSSLTYKRYTGHGWVRPRRLATNYDVAN